MKIEKVILRKKKNKIIDIRIDKFALKMKDLNIKI
jgi:hypothetical protein